MREKWGRRQGFQDPGPRRVRKIRLVVDRRAPALPVGQLAPVALGRPAVEQRAGGLDAEAARLACEGVREALEIGEITADLGIGRVTLVGAGMKSNAGITAKMFETLASHDINIEMISTSSIRISTIIRGDRVVEAVRALHTAFGLDA